MSEKGWFATILCGSFEHQPEPCHWCENLDLNLILDLDRLAIGMLARCDCKAHAGQCAVLGLHTLC